MSQTNNSQLEGASACKGLSKNEKKPCSPCTQKNSHASSTQSNSNKITPQKFINPFKIGADDLRNSHLSPNVFSATEPNPDQEKNKSFRWSIDQLADLKPVDIDESSHQDVHGDESECEELVQTAIDDFFSGDKVIIPSPWPTASKVESSAPKSHPATFSPDLASTAYHERYEDAANSEKSTSCSSMQDASTQTVLTVPLSVNLEEILSSYHTFNENQQKKICKKPELGSLEESKDTHSNSSNTSLRRKLFHHIEDKCEKDERFMFNPHKLVYQKSPPVSPVTIKTPPHQNKTNTPGSSSPITPIFERKVSGEFSTVNMLSPAMSPIQKSAFKTSSTSSLKNEVENCFRIPASNKSDCTPKRKVLSFENIFKKNLGEFGNVSGIEVADENSSISEASDVSASFYDVDKLTDAANQLLQKQKLCQKYFNICSTRIHSNSTEDLMEISEQNSIIPGHDTGYQSSTQAFSTNDNISLSKLNVYNTKSEDKELGDRLRSKINDESYKTPPRT